MLLLIMITQIEGNKEGALSSISFIPQGEILYSTQSHIVIVDTNVKEPIDLLTILSSRLSLLQLHIQENRNSKSNVTNEDYLLKINLIKNILQRSKELLTDLRSFTGFDEGLTQNIRDKRSLCDGCGQIIQKVFGLSTDQDLNNVDKKILMLNKEKQKILHILDHSLTIMNQLKNRTIINHDNIVKIRGVVRHIVKNTNLIYQGVLLNQKNLEITLKLNDIIVLLDQVAYDITNFKIALLYARDNILTPTILPVSNLESILTAISQEGQHSPIVKNYISDAYIIYNTATVQVRFLKGHLRFYISIPSRTIPNKFHLFKTSTLPLPSSSGSYFIYLQPSTEYFAVTDDRILFTPISYKELSLCKKVNPGSKICMPKTHFLKMPKLSCEWSLLRNDPAPPCQVKYIKNFIPISRKLKEGYLYAVPHPIRLTVSCPTKGPGLLPTVVLNGTGTFHLQPQCSASSIELYFPPHTTISKLNFSNHLIFQYNFSAIDLNLPNLNKLEENPLQIATILNKSNPFKPIDLSTVSNELALMTSTPSIISMIHQYHSYLLWTLFIISLLMFVAIKKYKQRQQQKVIDQLKKGINWIPNSSNNADRQCEA